MLQPWHALEVEDVVAKLNSNIKLGLSQNEAERRLIEYGTNTLPTPEHRSFLSIFFRQFLSPLIYLLLMASLIAFFIGDVKDALIILVVVFLNAVIGSLQEFHAEQSLATLRRLEKLKTRVLRSGKERQLEASELVPGDILVLSSGDAVPADARLIEASSLTSAEASLTGESLPTVKSVFKVQPDTLLADRHCLVHAGTYIISGHGLAVVVTTGASNEIGKIASLTTKTAQPKTQLELRIQQFGRYLVVVALIIFALVIAVGLLRGIPLSQIFMIAISQMVSLVPEGLPVAMTIALAVGVQRMAHRGTIVRRLTAIETLGSTTVICTDKTGTLTRNEMTVTNLYLPVHNREIDFSGSEQSFSGSERSSTYDAKEKTLTKLFEICCLCNDAELLGPNESGSHWKALGDPTEGALLIFAAKMGADPTAIRKKFPRMAELPFHSNSKMMATQHQMKGKNVVFIKGAPEAILNLCNSCYDEDQIVPLNNTLHEQVLNAEKKMANSALRVLALGFIEDNFIDGSKGFSPFAGQVTLVGLIGELDPPKEEVANAVRACQAAGVRTVMVTGDHKNTGVTIAKILGIANDTDLAIDGKELDLLSNKDLLEKIDRVRVFARVHPTQKLRIVEAYQAKGEIVAMTGDGVNDAPALVRANVGVAMGTMGTEVAKEASKIIITDDNFATIVGAISEGRLVYKNLKKLLLFLFVTSLDEVIVLFLTLFLGYPPPLAAVQILWINLIAEGTLTVTLIMDPPEGNELDHPPIPPHQPLLDRTLLKRIPLMVLATVTSTLGWFIYRTSQGISPALVQTETFTILVICQWFNVLNCRSATRSVFSRNSFKNPWLLGALILSNALLALVIYWPPLGSFFHTLPIEMSQLFEIGIVASLVLWVEELRKFISNRLFFDKRQKK